MFVNIRTVLADMKLLGVRIYEFDAQMHSDCPQRRIRKLLG